MIDEEGLDLGTRQDQAAKRAQGNHVGGGGLAEQDGDLAEEVAPAEPGAILAVDPDRDVAVEDDVEARAAEPLAQDALTLREPGFVERVRDGLQLGPREVGEQG